MKRIVTASLLALMTGTLLTSSIANAQPQQGHDRPAAEQKAERPNEPQRDKPNTDQRDARGWHKKSDYRKGGHVAYTDWQRGKTVDYRKVKNLSKPPKGHEWRKVDNRYVLAAVATGVIVTVILSK